MIEFIYNHPDYLFFLLVLLFFVYKVILQIINLGGSDEPDDGDDGGGGIFPEDPELDLPPGVSLHVDQPELVEH